MHNGLQDSNKTLKGTDCDIWTSLIVVNEAQTTSNEQVMKGDDDCAVSLNKKRRPRTPMNAAATESCAPPSPIPKEKKHPRCKIACSTCMDQRDPVEEEEPLRPVLSRFSSSDGDLEKGEDEEAPAVDDEPA